MGACPELERDTSKDTTQNFSLTKKNDDLFVQLFIRLRDETLSVVVGDTRKFVQLTGGYKLPFPIPETQSAFHPLAQ
jgi:hypothetical protein